MMAVAPAHVRHSDINQRIRTARHDIDHLLDETETQERRLSMFGKDYCALLLALEVTKETQLRMRLTRLELVKRLRKREVVLVARVAAERKSLRCAARSQQPRLVSAVGSPCLDGLTEQFLEARQQRIRAEELVARARDIQLRIDEKIGLLEMEREELLELVQRGVTAEATRTCFLTCLRGERHLLSALAADVAASLQTGFAKSPLHPKT